MFVAWVPKRRCYMDTFLIYYQRSCRVSMKSKYEQVMLLLYCYYFIYRSFNAPHPSSDVIQDCVGNFTSAINNSLRKGSSREFSLHVVFRHDVYHHLFLDKKELFFNDFNSRYFKVGWDQCYHNYRVGDKYNNGHRLEYPVLARPYLKWTKNAHYKRDDGIMIIKSKSFVEMVSLKIKKINC